MLTVSVTTHYPNLSNNISCTVWCFAKVIKVLARELKVLLRLQTNKMDKFSKIYLVYLEFNCNKNYFANGSCNWHTKKYKDHYIHYWQYKRCYPKSSTTGLGIFRYVCRAGLELPAVVWHEETKRLGGSKNFYFVHSTVVLF